MTRTALVAIAILVCAAHRSEAQIGSIPGLADPRPDPLFLLPIVTTGTQLRVVGLATLPERKPNDPTPPALIGETPTIRGQLTLFLPGGSADPFTVGFQSVVNKAAPHRVGFTGLIETFKLIGDVPANTGATLSLDCTNCPRGSRLSGGVYVEEISAVQNPSFSPYVVSILDPNVDGVPDPKTSPIIEADGVVLLPVVTSFTRVRVMGYAFSRPQGFRDPDTLGLIGDTPTIRAQLTLMLPDGSSRWFDISLAVVEDGPYILRFAGMAGPDLIGDVPANTAASLAFDCENCPRGTRIGAGVYVDEISAVSPSFRPYVVGLLDPKVVR